MSRLAESPNVTDPIYQDSGGEATENVDLENLDLADAYLELQVVQPGKREYRFPFFSETLDLETEAVKAFENPVPWTVQLSGDRVTLKDRASKTEHSIGVGEMFKIEDREIWLIDARTPPLGSLEGVSQELTGQVWHLKNQHSWLGRKGKRLNHIELDHPTISRTHCTFLPDGSGNLSLLSESSATSVNGQALAPGQSLQLANADLLGLGKLQFRFRSQTARSEDLAKLYLRTLGGFQVTVDRFAAIPAEFRSEKARWILALLGTRWGKAQAVEPMLESFWPGTTSEKGRRNLSYSLSQLNEGLEKVGLQPEALIFRTPTHWQLKPEALGQHDYIEVQRLVSSGQALSSEASLDRILSLYRGKFLPACYEDWAETLRSNLESDLLQTLLATAQSAAESGQVSTLQKSCQKLLELDPLHEEAACLLIAEELKAARPEVAVSIYEAVEKSLKAEDLEPSIELVKLYHRARLGI